MIEQRRAILSVIETASKHLDASRTSRKAQKVDPSVDRSTVYRTLGLLKRQSLIDELDSLPALRQDYGIREREIRLPQAWAGTLVARLEVGGYCIDCRR